MDLRFTSVQAHIRTLRVAGDREEAEASEIRAGGGSAEIAWRRVKLKGLQAGADGGGGGTPGNSTGGGIVTA